MTPAHGAPAAETDAPLDPIARRLQAAIGLRPDGISALRLRHAAREVAGRRGVTAASLPGILATDPSCRQELVDRVTVQESQFFRDAAFFAALQSIILPSLGGDDEVTIWSAGCAHGQEAYSVAMLLAESGRTGWRVLATDVSARALSFASDASFAERELRGLSPARRERFLTPGADGRHLIAAPVRARVDFAAHNLIGDPLPAAATSARLVLMRNVLIYFEPATTQALLRTLAQTLPPGSWILLGGSEVLHPTIGLELTHVAGIYGYRVPARPARARPVGSDRVPVAPRPPRPTTTVAEPSPDALRERGEAHAAAGEHAEAIRCFRQLVYLDGGDVGARIALALSFEAAGDVPAAVRALRATATALATHAESGARGDYVPGWRTEDLSALVDDRLTTLEGVR